MTSSSPLQSSIQLESPNRIKQRIILVGKLSFVVGLLYFLSQKGFISVQLTQQALQQWKLIVPAVLGMLFTGFLGVIRWQWLLQAQNIHMTWLKTFQLTFIGNFFNIALPGAVSGDFVKAFYIGKEYKGHRARAFGSILFDRVVGLSALVLVSAGALLFGIKSYLNSPLITAIQFVLGTGAFCVILFYAYLFLVREKSDPVLRLLTWLEIIAPKLSAVTVIYKSLRHYHNHRWTVLKALLVSILIHVTVSWACLCFSQALGETQLNLTSLCIVVPLGLLVTAVPVAPAGVGTGNVAFLYLFQLISSQRGGDVYSLVALTNIFLGSIGGFLYFRFKGQKTLGTSLANHARHD